MNLNKFQYKLLRVLTTSIEIIKFLFPFALTGVHARGELKLFGHVDQKIAGINQSELKNFLSRLTVI